MENKFNNCDILWTGMKDSVGDISLLYNIFDYKQIAFVSKYSGGLYSPDHKILITNMIKTNSSSEQTGQGNEYYFESASINGKSYGMAFYVRPGGENIYISHMEKTELIAIIGVL